MNEHFPLALADESQGMLLLLFWQDVPCFLYPNPPPWCWDSRPRIRPTHYEQWSLSKSLGAFPLCLTSCSAFQLSFQAAPGLRLYECRANDRREFSACRRRGSGRNRKFRQFMTFAVSSPIYPRKFSLDLWYEHVAQSPPRSKSPILIITIGGHIGRRLSRLMLSQVALASWPDCFVSSWSRYRSSKWGCSWVLIRGVHNKDPRVFF
jgi:hypothetical protein